MGGRPAPGRRIRPDATAPDLYLSAPCPDGRPRQPCRVRHQSIASVPDDTRLSGRPYPSPALIQDRFDRSVLLHDRGFEFEITSHGIIRAQIPKPGKLICATLLRLEKPVLDFAIVRVHNKGSYRFVRMWSGILAERIRPI